MHHDPASVVQPTFLSTLSNFLSNFQSSSNETILLRVGKSDLAFVADLPYLFSLKHDCPGIQDPIL